MIKRAAIYARVSKAYRENEERITIESQIAECEAHCQQQGYIVARHYVDKDKYRVRKKLVEPSATRKDRPGYVAMLKAARAGDFDVIVAWKEDRLYRGVFAAIPFSEVLDEYRNLSVELVKDKFDRKMLELKASIAKIEIDNIRDRMVMGRRYRIERGECPGGPTRYGYEKGDDKRLVINPEEAQIIRMVYDWYIEGYNSMEIRRRLNGMGILPRSGNLWSKATIQNILTFEGYVSGWYLTTLDGTPYKILCEPIINMSIWDKSKEVRAKNKTYRGRNVKEDYLCRGIVTCLCNWSWTAHTRTLSKKYEGKWGYYACARKEHQPEMRHPKCPGGIGAKKLDHYVWDFVLNICRNPEIVHALIDEKISSLQAELGDIEAEVEQLNSKLDMMIEERQWVITMARKNKISEYDMDMQLGAIEFQALDLRKKRDDKLSALMVKKQGEYLKEWAEQFLMDIAKGIQVLQADLSQFNEQELEKIYQELDAVRFEERSVGDKMEVLKWAIFEEKRKIVRALIDKVLVVGEPNGEKRIIPILALTLPADFASLVYDYQSLAYIESWRKKPVESIPE